MTITAQETAISLELVCRDDQCRNLASPLFLQLSSGRYDECSVLAVPRLFEDWRAVHKTARKRADRARRRGYTPLMIDRSKVNDQITSINTSSLIRQKRPMSSSYLEPVNYGPLPHYPCARHAIRTFGVMDPAGTLVAYLWLYRCGELALVSQILGHADHLENEVMWLLFAFALEYESALVGDGIMVYNRHDSGTDGLRWFKERCGFQAMPVEWLP